ncbi:MAG: sigma-70 family RNA polymerase sigma factor [Planctomycetota bacterium]
MTGSRESKGRPDGTPEIGDSYQRIEKAKGDGSETSWTYLFDRYQTRARLYAECRIGPKLRGQATVDDLMQEVWLKTCRGIGDFEYQGPDSFYRWICLNIRRVAADLGRGVRPEVGAVGEDGEELLAEAPAAGPGPRTEVGGVDVVSLLRDALADVPELFREVLVEVYLEGRDRAEVAAERGLKRETLKKQLQRGLEKWRESLGGLDPLEHLG